MNNNDLIRRGDVLAKLDDIADGEEVEVTEFAEVEELEAAIKTGKEERLE